MNALKCRTLRAMSLRHEFMPLWTDLRMGKYAWALSTGKWPTVRTAFNGGVLDLCNRAVSEKTPQFFNLRSAEYATGFSGQIDAPEVRCDLTHTHTHTHTHTEKSARSDD